EEYADSQPSQTPVSLSPVCLRASYVSVGRLRRENHQQAVFCLMQEPLTRSLDLHQGSGVHLPQGGLAKRLSPLAAGLAIESQMTKSWMPKCLFPDNDRRG